MKTLYHATTPDRADSIMAGGFRDHATVDTRLTRTFRYEPGVWFGDVPVLDDELFDGVGLFDFDAERQVFIAIDLSSPIALASDPYAGIRTSVDETWPGTQYWAKATTWNQFSRKLMSLDEIIVVRLAGMSQKNIRDLRRWLSKDRDYMVAFADRVRRVLGGLEGAYRRINKQMAAPGEIL